MFVGLTVARRPASPRGARAVTMFSVWWIALGASALFGAARTALGAFGSRDLALFVTLFHANLLILSVALWALFYYFVVLFTGRDRLLYPLAAVYAGVFVGLVFLVTWRGPIALAVDRWSVSILYERALPGPLLGAVLLAILLPHILGALAYATLFFRLKSPTKRYRVALVSGSFILWFGSALAASLLGVSSLDAWQVASRAIGLAAAGTVILAYHPPAWVTKRYGVVSLEAEGDEQVA